MNKDDNSGMDEAPDIAGLTAEIVSAYVANNSVMSSDLPKVIADVSDALRGAATKAQTPLAETPTPVVPIEKSVTPDHIICLEDGKKFRSLKRHLRTHFNLSPVEYREKWGLPFDYPMVAPNYTAARSALAKKMGLGRGRRS